MRNGWGRGRRGVGERGGREQEARESRRQMQLARFYQSDERVRTAIFWLFSASHFMDC